MTEAEVGRLFQEIRDLRTENTACHDKLNELLSDLEKKVVEHDIDIRLLKQIKKWVLKNLWWLVITTVVGLLGSGGALWQFIEAWQKRGMPG
ncbi:MAG: hypothetical protein WC329_02025 [Candidatus Omnitrophota bacterium]|jgi:hypothetical protein